MISSLLSKKCKFLLACTLLVTSAMSAETELETTVGFLEFHYKGMDPVFELPLPEGSYRNPILAGFYPDPSICRAGDTFYLVNSSFAYFPGIPIFESKDLVNWKQIGHVLDRPSQLNTAGLRISEGIFAPAIEYHEGIFYVVSTQVGGGGNFYVTATNPAGPWSDPILLPSVGGIDPSLFFDDDGRVYLVHNDDAPNNAPLYDGHRAIYLWELDIQQGKTIAGPTLLVNGGVDITQKPIWIEGPHLYKKDGYYYLMCAEGGTGPQHAEVIFRSRSLEEPFEPLPYPILTQRDLDPGRTFPVDCVGHADMIETGLGEWWAVFLGTRPYDQHFYATGRETFLLPVTWTEDGWPMILEQGVAVPPVLQMPALQAQPGFHSLGRTGNFSIKEPFADEQLGLEWIYPRTPDREFVVNDAATGIALVPSPIALSSHQCASYIGRRQQHMHFEAMTVLDLTSMPAGVAGGLAIYQSENAYLFLGVSRSAEGEYTVFLEKMDRGELQIRDRRTLPAEIGGHLKLGVREQAGLMDLWFEGTEGGTKWMQMSMDSKFLSTAVAGGFVGSTVGLHARTD
jgi:xylan 1,4-beta-xylosidase